MPERDMMHLVDYLPIITVETTVVTKEVPVCFPAVQDPSEKG